MIENHYENHSFRKRTMALWEPYKNSRLQTLFDAFCEKYQTLMPKNITFSLFLVAFCAVVNHHFSHEENAIRRSAKTRTPIPYKHCRLRRLWTPISANWLNLLPKTIGFCSVWRCGFPLSATITFS